ncbi:nucleotide exchange factor GrpE [Helicobacter sp.]|uniref:nucleotide exchange factor GrpE n=1 Tax=Helicobacter sp. TaxID=218 RepID=UPI00388FF383
MQETKNNDINQAQDTCDNTELESSQDSALASGESMESTLDSSAPESNTAGDEPSMLDAAYKELEEKYMRAYADFENVKKRLEREKNQALEYAYEKIARDLLPVLDALDSAKEAAKEHEAIAQGIMLTQESFLKALQKHGIESISTDGEFDPNVHECIMQVNKPEAENGHIAQVMQRGYKYKERTLRPAMVAVVKND